MDLIKDDVEGYTCAMLDDIDKDGAQRIIERGNELKALAIELKEDFTTKLSELSFANQYADEEVKSKYGYLSGYTKPNGITEQTNRLRQLFRGIGFANEELAKKPLPANTEGYFAIPRWQSVAKTYSEAVQIVLDHLEKAYKGKFGNYREGQIDEGHIRMSARTAAWFDRMGEEQKGYDILVVPAQFGIRHAGRSVRRAVEVMFSGEFGLDAFSIGIMLLTHANRLQHNDDLWIDCAGTEWSPGGDGAFSESVCFDFGGGKLRFGDRFLGAASGSCGSASGFGSASQGDLCASGS